MIGSKQEQPIIQLFHVSKQFGPKAALVDISLNIRKGEYLLVSGASGAGKTTLLKLLYLGEPVTRGQILIDGMNLSRIPRKRIPFLRRKFGIIFQDYKLIPSRTVYENVSVVLEAAGQHKQRIIEKQVKSALRTVGMEGKEHALPPSLSGGEQQRVAVARAVIGRPKIILADEPTGSLDSDSAKIIIELLNRFHLQGATVLIATHDSRLIQKENHRLVHLVQGEIVTDHAPSYDRNPGQ
jgi:cell division transport system ATP-binding protein